MILYSYEDMMLRQGENKKKNGDILGGGEQLNELEDIRNASSLDKTQSNVMYINSMEKEKKSIWRWETFKSLTKIGSKKFNCCFTLQVHGVEGLPPFFDNMRIYVHWKRKDEEFSTRPSRVIDGVADFDDYLIHSCSIYGSSSGANRSAKYGSKHFLLYISVYDNGDLDLGKHRIDLTRILPLTLEELEEKKSGNWTTSFKLSGLAKGATMKVSFGYMLVANSPCSKSSVASVRNASHLRQNSEIASKNLSNHGRSSDEINLRRVQSNPVRPSLSGISMDDIKDLHEILPASTSEYSESNNSSLDNKLGIDGNAKSRLASFILSDDKDGYELDDFSIIDKGVEIDQTNGTSSKKELMKDLELALDCASNLAKSRADFQEDECLHEKDHLEVMSNDMESEPESPREQLLREFEEGDLDHFCSLIDYDMESEGEESNDGTSFTSAWKTISGEYKHRYSFSGVDQRATLEMHPIKSISSVSQLEGLDTEALMREWGVNEKDFQNSPRRSISGLGSTTDLPPESSHYELPQLGEGLGSSIPTRNGGFIRSMNPSLFRNAKSGGNLVMQVSNPVVVPAEMGPGIMDILQHLASIGIEKLSVQANKLMTLEDITGKTMQQVAYEGSVGLLQQADELENSTASEGKDDTEWSDKTNSSSNQSISIEQITLENLAPLAMEKIEALFLEGLRIQSTMSDDYASKDIIARTTSGFSTLLGNKANVDDRVDLEGISGLQLLDIKNNVHDDDDDGGLMSLSLPLNEWMKLDAGNFDDEENMSERTYRILAAHHAKSSSNARSHGEGRKGGLLRNNFTIALMVQLRDPLRNFESVGTPMLSLIQIERVFSPFTQSIRNINYEVKNTNEDEDENEEMKGQTSGDKEEKNVTKYTIYKVHVAGFVSDTNKKKLWGSPTQQRSGSRWLLANGMGKTKHPLTKTKFVSNLKSCPSISTLKNNNVQPSDSLWSISSGIRGCGHKWKGHDVMNPHTRNPNIIFPKRTLRLW